MRRLDRPYALVASGLVFLALLILVAAARAQGVSLADEQRQLDRIEQRLDRLEQRLTAIDQETLRARVDGFSRLAAVEREVMLNRTLIAGITLGLLGNLFTGLRALQRIGKVDRTINGRAAD